MSQVINLDDEVLMNSKLQHFLKMKNSHIKFNVLLNYVLCNHTEREIVNDEYEEVHNNHLLFIMNNKLLNFFNNNGLKINNIFYSKEEIGDMLSQFVTKQIHIII
jgi:hypothetical protein